MQDTIQKKITKLLISDVRILQKDLKNIYQEDVNLYLKFVRFSNDLGEFRPFLFGDP
jgi:hypothetical protein